MGSNVLDQSSLVLLAMEDQGSCITLGLRIRDPVSVLYVLRLRIRDPVSVSYVLRNLVKVWCLPQVLIFKLQSVFPAYLGQFKSKSPIQGHFWKLEIKTFN